MNPELWKRVEAVYHQAMEQSAERRASFVEAACAGDRDLRAEVMELLAHADGGSAELRQPVSAATDAILGHPATSLEGQTIGQYQIERWLGAGGAGHVYRARDLTLGRAVALKFLAQAFTRDPSRIARLRSEAQLLARLNHPHIATIYDLEESGPAPFLVLELVDGETLDARIRRSRLSVQEAIAFALQLASALEAAHERGVIHGDLKPANVALTHDECLKVLDFGLAVVTRTEPSESNDVGAITGTPAYMAPEVIKGRQADKRSDVWGFGCALFEMLTGQRAFRGKDVPETLAAVMFEEPDWSALPSVRPHTFDDCWCDVSTKIVGSDCAISGCTPRARDTGGRGGHTGFRAQGLALGTICETGSRKPCDHGRRGRRARADHGRTAQP